MTPAQCGSPGHYGSSRPNGEHAPPPPRPGDASVCRDPVGTSPVPPARPALAPLAPVSPLASFGFLPSHQHRGVRRTKPGRDRGSLPPGPPQPPPSPKCRGSRQQPASGAATRIQRATGRGRRARGAARLCRRRRTGRAASEPGGRQAGRRGGPPLRFPPAKGCREASGRDNGRPGERGAGIRRRNRQVLHVPGPGVGGDSETVPESSSARAGERSLLVPPALPPRKGLLWPPHPTTEIRGGHPLSYPPPPQPQPSAPAAAPGQSPRRGKAGASLVPRGARPWGRSTPSPPPRLGVRGVPWGRGDQGRGEGAVEHSVGGHGGGPCGVGGGLCDVWGSSAQTLDWGVRAVLGGSGRCPGAGSCHCGAVPGERGGCGVSAQHSVRGVTGPGGVQSCPRDAGSVQ